MTLTYDRPILSVLIASLRSRHYFLGRIVGILKDQVTQLGDDGLVQIIAMVDNGETPIGIKRNAMVMAAAGTYVAHVDDDDVVSDNYLSTIIPLLRSEPQPDCIELNGIITTDGGTSMPFVHSVKYKKWEDDGKKYYRSPGHLNPIKRSIAVQFMFPAVRYGEDYLWSNALCASGLLRNEAKCDKVLYHYNYSTLKKKERD